MGQSGQCSVRAQGVRAAAAGALAALCSAVAIAGAHAETAASPQTTDITGAWMFETAPLSNGACVLSGVMDIAASEHADTYSCGFSVDQFCHGGVHYHARQSCHAQMLHGALLITSRVDSVEPAEVTPFYYRDNFVLRDVSGEEMHGDLVSLQTVSVKFWRGSDAIS